MVASVVTRWWSAWLLAERVSAIAKVNKEALNIIKTSHGWKEIRKLKDEDYALINLFVEFFRPMKEFSDILGGEQFSTIQLVLPGVKEIRRQIKKHEDHPVIGAFVQDFCVEFSRYFDFVDDPLHEDFVELYTIAAYLSPFHQIILTMSEKSRAKESIKNKLSLMWVHSSGGQQEDASVEVPAQQVPDIMLPGMDLILDMIQSGEADNVEEISAFELAFKTDIERLEKDSMLALQKFKTTRKAPEGDVLDYWNEFRYTSKSGLPDLACDTLVAPAASVSSERLFSSAGSLSSGKRHNISAKNLECRVLLRANKDL